MKIRSITYFLDPGWPIDEKKLRVAGEFLAEAKAAFDAAGYEVQTVRLATVSFVHLLGEQRLAELPRLASEMSSAIQEVGIAYASLGPALPASPRSYQLIPEAVAASENIFFGGVMASRDGGLSLPALRACAETITRLAPLQPDGFANLRFAALANVPPGSPFFPAAYWEGDQPSFAIATQAADLAVQAFSDAHTLEQAREALITAIQRDARQLETVASRLKFRSGLGFGGIDFSLAPFPDASCSLGAAVELMGVPRVGLHGSLAAAALLTEAVESADFHRTGFSGFMQPVLEDPLLAERAAQGTLTVKDLLLYSAVCGTGLDTIPLPGDTTSEQIASLLLDLSALALRLDKPLTARLMPIPGKTVADPTNFDFGYFANGRVMRLDAAPLQRALAGSETFHLRARTG
jgi:uncharacterized protein